MCESTERSVLRRATWCHIPEDNILHSHHHENLKSYISIIVYFIVTYTLGAGQSPSKQLNDQLLMGSNSVGNGHC
jgi:hypothetical protein